MDKQQAKTELRSEWAELPTTADVPDFLDDCAAISAALSEGPVSKEVAAGMKWLENDMFSVFASRVKPKELQKVPLGQKEWCRQLVDAGAFDPKKEGVPNSIQKSFGTVATEEWVGQGRHVFSKLLTTVLAAREKSLGYRASQDPYFHPVYYIGKIEPDQFLQNIALGYHWKDVGVPGSHGEFTHQMQWYVIARGGVIPANRIAHVYRMIGEFTRPAEKPDDLGQTALWARVCDRVNKGGHAKPEGPADFRCPEFMTDYLTKGPGWTTYPLLAGFIKARLNKRSGNTTAIDDVVDYAGPKKQKYEHPLFFE